MRRQAADWACCQARGDSLVPDAIKLFRAFGPALRALRGRQASQAIVRSPLNSREDNVFEVWKGAEGFGRALKDRRR
jgi:hypothetical protein